MGDALPDELVREFASIEGVAGKGGVVPNDELVRLDGGDMLTGDKGGVVWAFASADQMVCPGKEPKLPVATLALLDEAGIGTQPLGTTERGQECDVPTKLQRKQETISQFLNRLYDRTPACNHIL